MPGGSKKGGGLEVGSAYKMKNTELASSMKYKTPMQANYASPVKEKPTEAELIAQADAQFGEGVKVSGGKKTVKGSFVQHPGRLKDGGGASIAGSSKEHSTLRLKKKKGTLTSSEKANLRELDAKTQDAYWAKQKAQN